MENVWNCPLCMSSHEQHHFLDRSPSKYWEDERYTVIAVTYAVCGNCGLVFLWDRHNDKENEVYYMSGTYRSAVQGTPHITPRATKEQELRAEFLMPHIELENVKSVLDIGASTGILLKALKERYDCEILGVEPSEHFRIQSKMKMFSEMAMLYTPEYYNAFDLITVIHTLEHMNEPKRFLVSLHEFITEDGHLLIEVPNVLTENALTISHPINFTPETLQLMLNITGWQVIWLKEYFGYKEDRTNPPNILVLAKPGPVSDFIPPFDMDEFISAYWEHKAILEEDNEKQAKKVQAA